MSIMRMKICSASVSSGKMQIKPGMGGWFLSITQAQITYLSTSSLCKDILEGVLSYPVWWKQMVAQNLWLHPEKWKQAHQDTRQFHFRDYIHPLLRWQMVNDWLSSCAGPVCKFDLQVCHFPQCKCSYSSSQHYITAGGVGRAPSDLRVVGGWSNTPGT